MIHKRCGRFLRFLRPRWVGLVTGKMAVDGPLSPRRLELVASQASGPAGMRHAAGGMGMALPPALPAAPSLHLLRSRTKRRLALAHPAITDAFQTHPDHLCSLGTRKRQPPHVP